MARSGTSFSPFGVLIGALAPTVVMGLDSRDAAAAKALAVSVDSQIAAYAAGQGAAADRRSDKIACNWWWSSSASVEAIGRTRYSVVD